MEDLSNLLSNRNKAPRLWFERLAIFSEPDDDHCIRTIKLRRGINLIWAREPAAGRAVGVHAAGHGVGKTSLCHLLRYCLGDNAKSVSDLREELFGEFPQGGAGAVLHIDNSAFTIFRFFNAHKDGLVKSGDNLKLVLQDGGDLTFREFESQFTNTLMANVMPRSIPETGQAIEWRHVLAWISRDQESGFKKYFDWREGEGIGLKRPKQDPPIVMRAVLGLLDQGESNILARISDLQHEYESEKQKAAQLRQEPILIRRRIESELRAWLKVSDDIPLRTDDLFRESVEVEIRNAKAKIEKNLAEIEINYDAANERLVELRAELLLQKTRYDQADADYQLADAARRKDESAYQQIANRRATLIGLAGWCEYGDRLFKDCQHVQDEIQKLQAINLHDRRDQGAMTHSIDEWTTRANQALVRKKELQAILEQARQRVLNKEQEYRGIRVKRDAATLELDRSHRLLTELERWEKVSGSTDTAKIIDQSIERCDEIARNIDSARLKHLSLQKEKTKRDKTLSEITDLLARELFSNEASGAFVQRNEDQPFQILVRGMAYRVLEVLLGDLVCMLDSTNSGSAFPGLLIHDCPREADMGPGLYENFLLFTERLERELYGDEVPFQYILTTTTPPPRTIKKKPYLREILDPSSDDGLLFRRRFRTRLKT